MNTDLHFPDAVLEEYSLHNLADCALLEEHLLLCHTCQDRLAEIEEYVRVVRAAAAILRSSRRSLRAAT